MNEKVFLTGGTGFIGSHLAPKLIEKGYNVHLLVRHSPTQAPLPKKAKIHIGDILDIHSLRKIVKEVQPHYVLHLAALTPVRFSIANPFIYAKTIYLGTMNMVDAALESDALKKFVHASSAEVYEPKDGELKETDKLNGITPYGISKVAADLYIRNAYDNYGLPYIVLRPTNTFGRKTEKGYFIEKVITTMMTSNKLLLNGDPSVVRDWLYVEDHVNGYVKAIESKKTNEVYNIGTRTGKTLKETVDTIKVMLDWKGKVEWGRKPRNEPKTLVLNSLKAYSELGWEPEYTFKQGIEKVIEFWKWKLCEK